MPLDQLIDLSGFDFYYDLCQHERIDYHRAQLRTILKKEVLPDSIKYVHILHRVLDTSDADVRLYFPEAQQ